MKRRPSGLHGTAARGPTRAWHNKTRRKRRLHRRYTIVAWHNTRCLKSGRNPPALPCRAGLPTHFFRDTRGTTNLAANPCHTSVTPSSRGTTNAARKPARTLGETAPRQASCQRFPPGAPRRPGVRPSHDFSPLNFMARPAPSKNGSSRRRTRPIARGHAPPCGQTPIIGTSAKRCGAAARTSVRRRGHCSVSPKSMRRGPRGAHRRLIQ